MGVTRIMGISRQMDFLQAGNLAGTKKRGGILKEKEVCDESKG
jgi:hypothetical protein